MLCLTTKAASEKVSSKYQCIGRVGFMSSDEGNPIWTALNDANKARARVYVEFFRAIEKRFGRKVAEEICREAIYRWGEGLAGDLSKHLPTDFPGLSQNFAYPPDDGAMFSPRVIQCDASGLDVQFETCPLKTGWIEAGLSDDDVALFCSMAACADYGTLEKAGYTVDISTWRPGQSGCCTLQIRAPR
jgi:hypothetical protein